MIQVQLAAVMGRWQAQHNKPLSIPDLVEKTGLSRDFLYRFHNGTIQRLDLEKLGDLCSFFECTPNDLLWTEQPAPSPVEYKVNPGGTILREG